MAFPSDQPPVPTVVHRLAADRPVRAVWVNEEGGTTFRIGGAVAGISDAEYVKVAKAGVANFGAEAWRLRWAARYVVVPRVLGVGRDGDLAWLRTRALPGLSAVHPHWRASPDVAVRAMGAGLRALHDRLPLRSCPFDWSAAIRVAKLEPARRSRLDAPPPVDRLVVCHGDACSPNTLIDDDGRCCGHVDLGGLGTADRWADLAVATLSLSWNYPGRSWDDELFAAYGVKPDPGRVDYYRRLWQAEDSP